MIEFLCPNEHKIRCPDDKAGRQAKCPKCGVSFRIPTLEELSIGASAIASPSALGVADAPLPAPSPGGSGKQIAADAAPAAPASAQPAAAKDRQIEFLCPNGHHLHGPATLQGRAGECPECGSRFRIPLVDEPEEAPEHLLEPQLAIEGEGELEEITLEAPTLIPEPIADGVEPLEFLQVLEGSGAAIGPAAGVSAEALGLTPLGGGAGGHPLAALFAEMWSVRNEGSRVEVHLESGSVVAPDAYVKSHSTGDYAVLVTKDPDGAATVTIVPWSSIARIILRALKQLPGEVVG